MTDTTIPTTCSACQGAGYVSSGAQGLARCVRCLGVPPAVKKKTRLGLLGALDKAIWRAIDDGRDAVLLYVRTGGKPDIKVTIELDQHNATRDTQVLFEGVDV